MGELGPRMKEHIICRASVSLLNLPSLPYQQRMMATSNQLEINLDYSSSLQYTIQQKLTIQSIA
jgi:hypothetical protein